MGLTIGAEHRHGATVRDLGRFADQSALSDPGWARDTDNAPRAVDRLVENSGDRAQLPSTPDKWRLAAPPRLTTPDAHQPPSQHRLLGTLDADHLGITQQHSAVDQTGCRFAEHHPTRRRHRLHPLGHTYLLADRGITQRPRADFTCDDLARVQADT